jgi:hypothetical protein
MSSGSRAYQAKPEAQSSCSEQRIGPHAEKCIYRTQDFHMEIRICARQENFSGADMRIGVVKLVRSA